MSESALLRYRTYTEEDFRQFDDYYKCRRSGYHSQSHANNALYLLVYTNVQLLVCTSVDRLYGVLCSTMLVRCCCNGCALYLYFSFSYELRPWWHLASMPSL